MIAFVRENEDNKILVLMNLSAGPVAGDVETGENEIYKEIFTQEERSLGGTVGFKMAPWEYLIFVKN